MGDSDAPAKHRPPTYVETPRFSTAMDDEVRRSPSATDGLEHPLEAEGEEEEPAPLDYVSHDATDAMADERSSGEPKDDAAALQDAEASDGNPTASRQGSGSNPRVQETPLGTGSGPSATENATRRRTGSSAAEPRAASNRGPDMDAEQRARLAKQFVSADWKISRPVRNLDEEEDNIGGQHSRPVSMARVGTRRTDARSSLWQSLVDHLPSRNPEAYGLTEALHMQKQAINPYTLADIADMALAAPRHDGAPGSSESPILRRRKPESRYARKSTADILEDRVAHKTLARKKSRKALRRTTTFGMRVDPEEELYAEVIADSKKIIKGAKTRLGADMKTKLEVVRTETETIKTAEQKVSNWAQRKMHLQTGFKHWSGNVKETFRIKGLWRRWMKKVEGRHGTAVSTYFVFLRWAFLLNFGIALLYTGLIIVPYAALYGFQNSETYLVPPVSTNVTDNAFIGLFTGGYPLNQSFYFIGSYMLPDSITTVDESFRLGLAYLLVCGGYLLFSFIIIFQSVATSVYSSAAVEHEDIHPISEIVFASYDHALASEKARVEQQRGLVLLLREEIADQESKEEYAQRDHTRMFAIRVGINFLVVVLLGLSIFAIQQTVEAFSGSTDAIEQLVPSIVLSSLIFTMPLLFEVLARIEKWRTPLFTIQLTVVRSLALRVFSLYVFFWTVLQDRDDVMCWETMLGQQIYNLFIITFLVELGTSSLYDVTRRTVWRHSAKFRSLFGPARFQPIKNTLELIFSQSLVWFGAFFCPMLPVLATIKYFILFYVKMGSTLLFCEPPRTAFRASHSLRGLIATAMFGALLCVAVPLGYTIIKLHPSGNGMNDASKWVQTDNFQPQVPCTVNTAFCFSCNDVQDRNAEVCFKTTDGPAADGFNITMGTFCDNCPSGCGPFRDFGAMYDIFREEYARWPDDARLALDYLSSVAMALIVIVFLIAAVIIARAKSTARYKLIKRLQIERDLERLDKIWILEKYSITLDNSAKQH